MQKNRVGIPVDTRKRRMPIKASRERSSRLLHPDFHKFKKFAELQLVKGDGTSEYRHIPVDKKQEFNQLLREGFIVTERFERGVERV